MVHTLIVIFFCRRRKWQKAPKQHFRWTDSNYWNQKLTERVTVIGNCCWDVRSWNGRKQRFAPGTRQTIPKFGFIQKAKPLEVC